MRSIARWQTKGHDWLELFAGEKTIPNPENEAETLLDYSYKGNGCGGGFYASSDEDAINRMEAPWGDPRGTGQVTVLKTDRPSLKRVR